jgi:hypothetical protein
MSLRILVSIGLALLVTTGAFMWYITATDGNPSDLYTNVQPTIVPQYRLPYVVHPWTAPNAEDHVETVHPVIVDR